VTTFANALKAQLEADPNLRRQGQRLLAILKAPNSARKRRRVDAMEQHCRAHLGKDAPEGDAWNTNGGDWSETSFDWKTWLGILFKLLMALLPFILAL
jgi:hypothetical protein